MTTKMIQEIREQPEVLGRILEKGWGEVFEAARTLRTRVFRSVMLAAAEEDPKLSGGGRKRCSVHPS